MANTATLEIVANTAVAANSILNAEFLTVSTDVATMYVEVIGKDTYSNVRKGGDVVVFQFFDASGNPQNYNATYNAPTESYRATVDIPNIIDTYQLGATINGNAITPINITVEAGGFDANASSITVPVASKSADFADFDVYVNAVDGDSQPLTGQSVIVTVNGVNETATYNASETRYEATFTQITTAGAYTVSATVGGQGVTNNETYTVVAGTAADFDITPSSITIAAGNNTTFTLQFKDQFDNPNTDNGGVTDVTFASSPVGISFGSTTLNADGTATVTATHTVADIYTITPTLVF